jgi:molybdopterin-guanine dinucleotide biosynthesis protein B
MMQSPVPILGIVAPSGGGKTTLLRKLLPLLRQRGLRVGYLKHSHHSLAIDQPGKDSHALAEAGAEQVLLAAADGWALLDYGQQTGAEGRLPLAALAARFDAERLDLLLVEGFRSEPLAKIEVHRSAAATAPLYPDDPNIVAVATDTELPPDAKPTRLPIDEASAIADFIVAGLGAGHFAAGDPRDELVRRCTEQQQGLSEPRAGWLSIRAGDRCWLARIPLSGAPLEQNAIESHLIAEPDAKEASAADNEVRRDSALVEAAIHRHIYAAQPRARAVVGARLAYAAAVGFQGRSFQPLDPDGAMALGAVTALSLELDELPGKGPGAIAEVLVEAPICILAGQGAYAWGASLTEALERATLLERSARVYVLGRQTSV